MNKYFYPSVNNSKSLIMKQTSTRISKKLYAVIVASLLLVGNVAMAQNPGGVSSAPAVWLKADAGTSTTTNNATLNQWSDQSTNARHHTQATASQQPTFKDVGFFNFNPSVSFDGGDMMKLTQYASGLEAVHTFMVVKPNGSSNMVVYSFHDGGAGGNQVFTGWDAGKPFSNTGGQKNFTGTGLSYGLSTHILPKNTDQSRIILNGLSANITNNTTYGYSSNAGYTNAGIGGNVNSFNSANSAVSQLNGEVAEVIIYKTGLVGTAGAALVAADINKIETYLAVKYGITLAHDYVNAAGTTIYDIVGAGYSPYKSNIIGLGKETATVLDQKQSRSINTNQYITIGNANTIATSNIANSNSLANGAFEMIGDNDSTTNFTRLYSPTSFTSASNFYREQRVWRVKETGSVGSIKIRVPDNVQYLLVSTNGAFGPTTVEVPVTPDGAGFVAVNYDFADGDYFSFGRSVPAPACAGGALEVWLQAKSITVANNAKVPTWGDNGPYAHTHDQTNVANQPIFFEKGSFNFEPSVSFSSGVNQWMTTNAFASGNEAVHIFTVSKVANNGERGLYGFLDGSTTVNWNNYIPSARTANAANAGSVALTTPTTGTATTPKDYGITQHSLTRSSAGTVRWNGTAGTLAGASTTYAYATNKMGVGAYVNSNGTLWSNPFEGEIAEVLIYKTGTPSGTVATAGPMLATEVERIESYLAMKYGITLSHNYFSSTGTLLYDVTAQAPYNKNVNAIGREDCADLNTKITTPYEDRYVTMAIQNGGITTTNTNNPGSLTNGTYELVGDNGAQKKFNTLYSPLPTSAIPQIPNFYRTDRVWKVKEVGTVGSVTLQAPDNIQFLLVSTDGTFNPATTIEVPVTAGAPGFVTVDYNFTDGQHFAFGRSVSAPACVGANLEVWLKAGSITSADSTKISTWNDAAPYARNHTQPTVGNQPQYVAKSFFNYEPSVYFPTANAWMSTNAYASGSEAVHIFTVSRTLSNSDVSMYTFNYDVTRLGWNTSKPSTRLANTNYTSTTVLPKWYGVTTHLNPKASGAQSVRWDGGTTAVAGSTAYTYSSDKMSIGANVQNNSSSVNSDFNGDIAEFIVYRTGTPTTLGGPMAATDVDKIESYLAIKYGITLSHNYFSSGGGTTFDLTAYAPYNKYVAGIGREDCGALNTRQSESIEDTFVTIGAGTGAFTATNALHTDTLKNNTYEI
jgi:large repetitive protein